MYSVAGEPENVAILYVQASAGHKADAVCPRPDAVDAQVAQYDDVARSGYDRDAGGAADQDAGDLPAAAIKRDALVIVTAPKPPGSRASISPPLAVFEIAPAQVLHGAVRLQGLTSSPTPEIQVRDACAWAATDHRQHISIVADMLNGSMNLRILRSPFLHSANAIGISSDAPRAGKRFLSS
jgi:hypothetical protein